MTDKKTRVQTQDAQTATTEKLELSPLEEKVVRMVHGLAAPANHELEMAVGPDNAEMVAKLQELEQRVIQEAGPRNNSTKRKIINSLRRK
jgi:hypothetical protein